MVMSSGVVGAERIGVVSSLLAMVSLFLMVAGVGSKLSSVGRGSVGGSRVSVLRRQLASISCSFLRSFLDMGDPAAKGRVFPERRVCTWASAAASAVPVSIQL